MKGFAIVYALQVHLLNRQVKHAKAVLLLAWSAPLSQVIAPDAYLTCMLIEDNVRLPARQVLTLTMMNV